MCEFCPSVGPCNMPHCEGVPAEPAPVKTGILRAPNGKEIIATADMIPGNALIQSATRGADGKIEVEYAGETKVCWDGQYTETEDGETLYVDEDGQQWKESALTFEDDGE